MIPIIKTLMGRMARGEPVAEVPEMSLSARYTNTNAPAINRNDMIAAASRLGVAVGHIEMVRKVESGGKSFDDKGRPVILFEPHVFHRRTGGKWSPSPFSYSRWGGKPYPRSYDARWALMELAAEKNETAALESASWGLFQIMGFHWRLLGYESAQDFAAQMAASEGNHLDAVVRFIEVNNLNGALGRCKAGLPETCREFAKGYNGSGYHKNAYHVRMAEALA